MIKLEIEVERSDLVVFYKFAYWQSPDKSGYRKKTRIQFGLGFALLPFAIFFTGAPFSASMGWNLLFFSSILFVLGYKLADKFAEARAEKGIQELFASGKIQYLVGAMSIELADDVIVWRTLNTETKIHRNGLEKLSQNQKHYFIFHTSMSGYVIPKRSFNSGEELAEFEKWWGVTREPRS
ncbi:hypothetical protein GCM10009119_24120 [Algoriphagus jejuensis]|uniref:YcxB-like C-terminal domain-containing protein n=1 Tax=Algoriphagus jejuensis TaxID=419934 RepID=A0ABN1N0T7_9BACT